MSPPERTNSSYIGKGPVGWGKIVIFANNLLEIVIIKI